MVRIHHEGNSSIFYLLSREKKEKERPRSKPRIRDLHCQKVDLVQEMFTMSTCVICEAFCSVFLFL